MAMNVFETFCRYKITGRHEWSEFIEWYQEVYAGLVKAEIKQKLHLERHIDFVIDECIEILSEQLQLFADKYSGLEIPSKSDLIDKVIALTDQVYIHAMILCLPQSIRRRVTDAYVATASRLGEIISERVMEFDQDRWEYFEKKHPLLTLEHSLTGYEEPGFEETARYLEVFTFDSYELRNKIEEWRIPWTAKAKQETSIITLSKQFDSKIYELIKKNPELLKSLDWRVFEEMLADILERFSMRVELTRATKDGGIDIIAIKEDGHYGLNKYILQAKRYKNAVQVDPVRSLLYLKQNLHFTKACLATTSTFTRGAWQLANQHKWELSLKDHTGILDWIHEVTGPGSPF